MIQYQISTTQIADFKKDLINQGLSERTSATYSHRMKKFMKFDKEFSKITADKFIKTIDDQSAATTDYYIKSIRKFGQFVGASWAKNYGTVSSNRGKKIDDEFPGDKVEFFLLIDVYEHPKVKIKWDMLWTLIVWTGMNPIEALNLKKIDFSNECVTVGKGSMLRTIPVSKWIMSSLKSYLSNCRTELLFAGTVKKTQALTYAPLLDDFKKRCAALNIEGYTPTSFRTSWAKRNVPRSVEAAKKILGYQTYWDFEKFAVVDMIKMRNLVDSDSLRNH